MNTILITGCSSGFGLDAASYFLDRDWTVIATMRSPRDDLLPPSDRLRILPLDVTDADSIAQAVEAAGPIDVLVNNAGVGQMGPLEGVSMAKIRELFEIRACLETWLLTMAIPMMNESDFEALEAIIEEMRPGEIVHWGELNWKFHEELYARAGRDQAARPGRARWSGWSWRWTTWPRPIPVSRPLSFSAGSAPISDIPAGCWTPGPRWPSIAACW